MRRHAIFAVTTGLLLRLLILWRFPVEKVGDALIYGQLAANWRDHGIYGLWIGGRLQPVDIRVPGYAAFLDAVSFLSGHHAWPRSVFFAQILLDLLTCFLIAAIASQLASPERRDRAWIAALWLAALCPFVANYAVTMLAEVLATFLTALALWLLIWPEGLAWLPEHGANRIVVRTCLLAGFVAGIGALVRPETPLLLAAAGAVVLWRCRRPRHWRWVLRTGLLLAAGMILPLLPWAARNWTAFHEIQFLNPRYSQLPGEYVPRGFYDWTSTWLWRFRDVYLAPWNLEYNPIEVAQLPASAFDSSAERDRVANLLRTYNQTLTLPPDLDARFAEIARERTARHPFRTCVKVPLLRAASMWFTPRIELLPYSGDLWPIAKAWDEDPVDFSVTLGLALLNLALVAMAAFGFWRVRRNPAAVVLLLFVVVRTAFFTHIETPEPRYMLECYPAVLAFAAQALL